MQRRKNETDSHMDQKEKHDSVGFRRRQILHTIDRPIPKNEGISSSENSRASNTSHLAHSSPKRAFRPYTANISQKKITRPISSHHHDACKCPQSARSQNRSSLGKATMCNAVKNVLTPTERTPVLEKALLSRGSIHSKPVTTVKITPSNAVQSILARPEHPRDLACRRVTGSIIHAGTADATARKVSLSARGLNKLPADPRSSKSAVELSDTSKSSSWSSKKVLHSKTRLYKGERSFKCRDAQTQTIHDVSSVSTLTEHEVTDCGTQTDTLTILDSSKSSPATVAWTSGDSVAVKNSSCGSVECVLSTVPLEIWSTSVSTIRDVAELFSSGNNALNNSVKESNILKINSKSNVARLTPTGDQCNLLTTNCVDELQDKRTVTEVLSVSGKTNVFLVSGPQENCITTRISPARARRPFFRCITENDTIPGHDGIRSPLPGSPISSPTKCTTVSPDHVYCGRIGSISPVLELDETTSSSPNDKLQRPRPLRKFHHRRLEHCQIDDVACEYPTYSEKCSPIVVPHPEAIDEQAHVVFVDMKARRLEEIIKLTSTRERSSIPTAVARYQQQLGREIDHSDSSCSTSTSGHYVGSSQGTEEPVVAMESEPQSFEEDDDK